VFGIFLAMIYMKLYAYYQPYDNSEDDFLQELAQYQIFITFFIALLVQSGAMANHAKSLLTYDNLHFCSFLMFTDLCPGFWWTVLFDAVLIITSVFTILCTKITAVGFYHYLLKLLPTKVDVSVTVHLCRYTALPHDLHGYSIRSRSTQ
jgi:magnesium-transporting ATPase (P-type)